MNKDEEYKQFEWREQPVMYKYLDKIWVVGGTAIVILAFVVTGLVLF